MIADLTENPPVQHKSLRKITLQDAEQMAELMAKRITEMGACHMLGINYETWRKWKIKKRNAPRYATIFERVRESKLNSVLESIDRAGDPTTVETAKSSWTRPGDWRAKAWIAERVLAPERFGQQVSGVTVNHSAITVQLGGDDALRRLIAEAARVALAGPQVLPPASEPAKMLGDGQTLPQPDKPVDV